MRDRDRETQVSANQGSSVLIIIGGANEWKIRSEYAYLLSDSREGD
jgi:hypothetical protein